MVLLTVNEARKCSGNALKNLSDEQIKQLIQNITNLVHFGLKEAEKQWKNQQK